MLPHNTPNECIPLLEQALAHDPEVPRTLLKARALLTGPAQLAQAEARVRFESPRILTRARVAERAALMFPPLLGLRVQNGAAFPELGLVAEPPQVEGDGPSLKSLLRHFLLDLPDGVALHVAGYLTPQWAGPYMDGWV